MQQSTATPERRVMWDDGSMSIDAIVTEDHTCNTTLEE